MIFSQSTIIWNSDQPQVTDNHYSHSHLPTPNGNDLSQKVALLKCLKYSLDAFESSSGSLQAHLFTAIKHDYGQFINFANFPNEQIHHFILEKCEGLFSKATQRQSTSGSAENPTLLTDESNSEKKRRQEAPIPKSCLGTWDSQLNPIAFDQRGRVKRPRKEMPNIPDGAKKHPNGLYEIFSNFPCQRSARFVRRNDDPIITHYQHSHYDDDACVVYTQQRLENAIANIQACIEALEEEKQNYPEFQSYYETAIKNDQERKTKLENQLSIKLANKSHQSTKQKNKNRISFLIN